MDLEDRLQHWLDDHGIEGSVAFNFSFFFLQLIFWSVIVCGSMMAITAMKGNGAGWSYNVTGRIGGRRSGNISRIERQKIEGHIARRNQAAQYPDRLARNTGRAVFWDDYAFRALESEICAILADLF